jgi:negative regulator of sigma E activity
MDDREVVLDELKQALINDPNISDQQERCNLYRSAFRGATEDIIVKEVCSGY